MSDAYIGEIRLFTYNYVPQGWFACEGQQLQIQQYAALYATISSIYGPATSTTFTLPNMRGRAAMNVGPNNPLAQLYGNNGITLNTSNLPAHNHSVVANVYVGTSNTPAKNMRFGTDSAANFMTYKLSPGAQSAKMADASLSPSGSTSVQPHENRQPFLALQFCICWDGIFAPNPG